MSGRAYLSLIRIRDLSADYETRSGLLGRHVRRVRAVDSLNLEIKEGETLSVVGESGCGKTTLGFTLLQLVPSSSGQILFDGQDILTLKGADLRKVRREMQIVFQNPFTSLNPRMNVKDLISEPLVTHSDLHGAALRARVIELLEEVGMSEEHLLRMPHQLSGGQAQRVAVARSLALNPRFLVLDEPTSALDVSVQAQVLNMLVELQERLSLTCLFITHDLSVVEHISDRVAVMYLGQIVELAPCETVFEKSRHPYTEALLSSTPILDPASGRKRIILEGTIPSPANPPPGCRFHTRCIHAMDICRRAPPEIHYVTEDHYATCHLLSNGS